MHSIYKTRVSDNHRKRNKYKKRIQKYMSYNNGDTGKLYLLANNAREEAPMSDF